MNREDPLLERIDRDLEECDAVRLPPFTVADVARLYDVPVEWVEPRPTPAGADLVIPDAGTDVLAMAARRHLPEPASQPEPMRGWLSRLWERWSR